MSGSQLPGGALVLLGALGVGAVAWWFTRRAGEPVQGGGMGSEPAGPGVGWLTESDVVLTEWIADAMDRLSAALLADGGPSITLLVTSGKRSATSQAAAMRSLITRQGYTVEKMQGLYRGRADLVARLYPLLAAGDLDAAAAILEEEPISSHQAGEAADVHRDSDAMAARVAAAGKAAGVRVLDEGHVLHLGA